MPEELDLASDAARTGEHADENRETLLQEAQANLRSADHGRVEKAQMLPAASDLSDVKEFSRSSNGDTWSIGKNDRGAIVVLHRGNLPSGGHATVTTVRDFLNAGPAGPQHDALVALLAVSEDPGDSAQPEYFPGTI